MTVIDASSVLGATAFVDRAVCALLTLRLRTHSAQSYRTSVPITRLTGFHAARAASGDEGA